ncbi:MAG: ATP-binding protein [Phaeodactylibacter sp.]|nr:ATP-binding protein [Phaeodactylibacter sp.]
MKYPIGIQDFRELREGGYVYVDKTEHIHRIVTGGKYFFLSRPRRFGKSLLLSTMKELFSGSRELFEELWIENNWDWKKQNPVIWLKFSSYAYQTEGLEEAIKKGLLLEAQRLGIKLGDANYKNYLQELIIKAASGGKAVLLIDEYDKPIIDYLDDIPQAESNRDVLKNLYSILKDSDPYLELVFITGVSAFSKVSIFSDLNNLENLSLSTSAFTLLGLTHAELEHYFPGHLQQVNVEEMKNWYNGYSWGGEEKVYNPFSILRFFKEGRRFQNFWFETGTPTFLVREMRKHRYYDIDNIEASEHQLSAFDFKNLDPVTVLFQTGYLTIDSYDERFRVYQLRYPNEEVRFSLQQFLLNVYRDTMSGNALAPVVAITKAFEAKDVKQVMDTINSVFSTLPYELWQKENEHFYHALVHLIFSLLGAYVRSEVHTSKGRCDAIVETEDHIYAIEFKLDKTAEEALRQVREKGYLEPFMNSSKEKIALGVSFSTAEKKVSEALIAYPGEEQGWRAQPII